MSDDDTRSEGDDPADTRPEGDDPADTRPDRDSQADPRPEGDDPADPRPEGDSQADPRLGRDDPADPRLDSEDEPESEAAVAAAEEQIAKLLSDLADDPDAPPTTVSGLSVILAARAAARAEQAAPDDDVVDGTVEHASTEIAVRPSGEIAEPAKTGGELATLGAAGDQSAGARTVLAAQAEAARIRQSRRRTGFIALVAAASLAGIAAVVIPLSLSGGSTTTTSADAARAGAAASAEAANPEGAAALASAPPGGESTGAADAGSEAAAGSGPVAGGESAAATPERPPPGPDAITDPVPLDNAAPSRPSTVPAGPTCWPALSEAASTALLAALPPGAFNAPTPLNENCGADPVGGAALAGTAPGTVLLVRVSKAEPGACARGVGEAGVRCVPRGAGVYVSTDGGGTPTAFAYGNGNEVVVGGSLPTSSGAAPAASGLSADQLVAAAQAVLGALG